MGINIEEAAGFETFGWKAVDDDGNTVFYFTFGSGSPVGQAAPISTRYHRTDASEMWIKFGAGNNDWEKFTSDRNLDGGFAGSVFKPSECFDGGDSNG